MPDLGMTPQLQLAVRLLGTPSAKLRELIDEFCSALEPLPVGEPDPLAAPSYEETEDFEEDGTPIWEWLAEPPLPALGADVWVFGNPPRVRANRDALPYLRAAATASIDDKRNAAWLFRALRQRAKTFERIAGAIVAVHPRLAIAEDDVPPVATREIAEAIGLHESTIGRVADGGMRLRNIHGVFALANRKRAISVHRVHDVE
jgi:DNA-directed RNA polymerase specialized sigma54-like protein